MARFSRWLPILSLIILSLLFFYKLAFTDMILARGDTYHYFYPYWDARNAALQNGELPLWTPNIFMGAPLLADPQIGTFYPPNWLMSPFTAPDGIRYSILLHVFWAALWTFLLVRRTITPSIFPALVAAAIFGLGGYIGAHVEQINQLQGLAWLPCLLYLFHRLLEGQRRFFWLIWLAIAWALQIFSGHSQTTFLSGVALGAYGLYWAFFARQAPDTEQAQPSPIQKRFFASENFKQTLKRLFTTFGLLALAAILAILLAAPQLLPTLELIGMSNRGAGLNANQATAFSLSPLYFGRALLPSYDGQLFGEYIGYVGVIGLILAIYGALSPQQNKGKWLWITMAGLGLFLALGRYNPVYWILAELPGFNLFRVPARWLALYALGMAMLAAYGLVALQSQQISWKRLAIALMPVFYLVASAWLFPVQAADIVGAAQPTIASFIGWAIALGIFCLILLWRHYRPQKAARSTGLEKLIAITLIIELFIASLIMPFNDLAPRDVYLGQRFTISQMLAYTEGQVPPPRMLSISQRYFSVGDIETLQDRYERMAMDEQAQATAFTAVKNQETLFPNLPLAWGIPTIDGYGGGLIPTIYYTQFSALLLPQDSLRSVDGRLGEYMALPSCRGACIPDLRYFAMTGTRYLISDKVSDIPVDGIFYDTAMANFWARGVERPNFEFTEVRVLLRDETISVLDWEGLQIFLSENSSEILAISAVDNRTNSFLQLQPLGIERILSSDIKIYDLGAVSRAYLASDVTILPDNWQAHEDALILMHAENFIPLESAVIHGDAEVLAGGGDVEIISYSPTRIEISLNADAATYLVLNDAFYEGWTALVNNEESPVYRANVLFRAVAVPAGESTVIFEFVPRLWYGAMAFGAVLWLLVLGSLILLWKARQV